MNDSQDKSQFGHQQAFGQRGLRPGQEEVPANPYAQQTPERIIPQSASEAIIPKEAPPPPKRSKQARNGFVVFFNFLMTSVVFVAVLAVAGFFYGKTVFEREGPLRTAQTVVIKEGQGLRAISNELERRGVIDNSFIFERGVDLHKASRSMKPGEYAFAPGMSMEEVMETIRSGKGVVYKVTIPEGWTTQKIFERVAADETLEGEMPDMLPEGSLMPDTYPFQRGAQRKEIIEQMRKAQEKFLAEVWERRVADLPIKTPQEMVTLASIVEKETGQSIERPRVASVFINRLNKGMRLQSDPTIIYGIFGGAGKPSDRPIYKSDIQKPTPYNTYTIDGLPPGPIANPGRASLEAVANPSKTDDLFFVADGTGGHVFAKTLDEHNANVRRWREIERRRKAEAEARAAEEANSDGEVKPEAASGSSN